MGIDTEYSFHIVICKDILAPYQNYSNSSSITHGECLIFSILLTLKRNADFLILKNQEWKTYVGTIVTVRWK